MMKSAQECGIIVWHRRLQRALASATGCDRAQKRVWDADASNGKLLGVAPGGARGLALWRGRSAHPKVRVQVQHAFLALTFQGDKVQSWAASAE